MGKLREKMSEDLRLRGCAPSTCESYLGCVRAFAAYHRRSPDVLGESEIRKFLLHLEKRKASASTVNVYVCAEAGALAPASAATTNKAAIHRGVIRSP